MKDSDPWKDENLTTFEKVDVLDSTYPSQEKNRQLKAHSISHYEEYDTAVKKPQEFEITRSDYVRFDQKYYSVSDAECSYRKPISRQTASFVGDIERKTLSDNSEMCSSMVLYDSLNEINCGSMESLSITASIMNNFLSTEMPLNSDSIK